MAFKVRTRLTLWYVSVLFVSLVLFIASFFYVLTRVYIDRTDEQISSVASMMVHTVVKPPGQIRLPGNFDIFLEKFFGVRTSGNFIKILGPTGSVIAKSSNLEGLSIPLYSDTYESAKVGIITFETIKGSNPYRIRIVTRPVVLKDLGLFAIVQVGTSLEVMDNLSRYMAYMVLFGLGLSVAIASVLGWFLARKALRPVNEVTTLARKIEAGSLNERLKEYGTDDEIGRLSSTFNEMIARLEKGFLQIKQFTADASHELKTPLTVMRGEIEVALRGGYDEEEIKELLMSTIDEIDRMTYIIRNLLTLARSDAEEKGALSTIVRLDAVVKDRVELVRKVAATKDVSLEVTRLDEVMVFGDPVGLGQVVSNLIDNAIKYNPSGGEVKVSLEATGGEAVFKVQDSGIGIAEDELPNVFERFYRTDKARTREASVVAGGVGLGLSICREIVQLYNGTIGADSEFGKGSTFTVKLPLVDIAKAAAATFGGDGDNDKGG